tara:strand:- start:1950 stop:3380 length:1431 start_codon:yes stop_codon:yes gene_type:complete
MPVVNTSFVFPDEADAESAKNMAKAMSKLPNHISTILEGMDETNYENYISVSWDSFKIDGKSVPKLNLLLHYPDTNEVVSTFTHGPYKLAPSFGRLSGNEESCITSPEQSAILDKKKAEDRSKFVAPTIVESKNKLTFRSFFDHEKGEVDPSIEALERLERFAHLIISKKCQEQVDGKCKINRINALDAKNCASQPENIPLLGKKFHKFVHKWEWEGHGYSQIRMNRNATKKGRPDEVVGLTPKVYGTKFKDNERIPFPFPMKVLCQEVPDNEDDEDEDPKVRAVKEYITFSDSPTKAEVIKFTTRSLVNYKSKNTGNSQELARITQNDTLRGDICTGKYGIPIVTLECGQSEKFGGYFSIKMSDLSWGLRSEDAFGVTPKIEGFIKTDREEVEDTESVNLALQFTRKASKVTPMKTIEEGDSEESEKADSDPESHPVTKRKRALHTIDEEPEKHRSKKSKSALSSEEVDSEDFSD